MMSCNGQIWLSTTNGQQHKLRKQKSCIDVLTSKIRKPILQKQLSLDQQPINIIRNQNVKGQYNSSNNNDSNNSTNNVWNSDMKPETNLITSVKKRTQTSNEINEAKLSDRYKKQTHRRDDRVNLNIFLSSDISCQDGQQDGADILSDNESSGNGTPQLVNTLGNYVRPTSEETQEHLQKLIIAASERRIQYHNSRSLTNPERRLPIVRAMSAPIRPLDDSLKFVQAKRRVRRKRIEKEKNEFQLSAELLADDENDLQEKLLSKSRARKIVQTKSKNSALGGSEIVTLVSLLSSGGSDSEREEISLNKGEITSISIGRTPMLRKAGKSVSFQENEDFSSLSSTSSREFPIMLRRGSIAPLAARIRSNRPPTAPPGSIFIKNCDKNEHIAEFRNQIITSKEIDKLNLTKNNIVNDEKTTEIYPEYVRSSKEKECWKLFEKMVKKGINVSYDTILRGMLTPTELREVQIKKRFSIDNDDTQSTPAEINCDSKS